MWSQPVENSFYPNSLQLFLSFSTINDLRTNTFDAFFFQTSSRGSNYHEAMIALRDSSTSPAVSLCWGSSTSSFRIRHTVFSDTRPSLWGGGEQKGPVLLAKCDHMSPQSHYWKIIQPFSQAHTYSMVTNQPTFCSKKINKINLNTDWSMQKHLVKTYKQWFNMFEWALWQNCSQYNQLQFM